LNETMFFAVEHFTLR